MRLGEDLQIDAWSDTDPTEKRGTCRQMDREHQSFGCNDGFKRGLFLCLGNTLRAVFLVQSGFCVRQLAGEREVVLGLASCRSMSLRQGASVLGFRLRPFCEVWWYKCVDETLLRAQENHTSAIQLLR